VNELVLEAWGVCELADMQVFNLSDKMKRIKITDFHNYPAKKGRRK